jgi:hypothetical protein
MDAEKALFKGLPVIANNSHILCAGTTPGIPEFPRDLQVEILRAPQRS